VICLTRRPREWIVIKCPNGDEIRVLFLKHKQGTQISLGFEAPKSYKVLRKELLDGEATDDTENVDAST
jgi:carbon storage regulator CsrA